MAYVTYKSRTSTEYRFTVDSLNDPAITDLKTLLKDRNRSIKRSREYNPSGYYSNLPTQGLRIRPRGSRKSTTPGVNNSNYDTPVVNATRFDVYIRDYK